MELEFILFLERKTRYRVKWIGSRGMFGIRYEKGEIDILVNNSKTELDEKLFDYLKE